MNLRQKAKRFKNLYEKTLPKKPYPVVIKTISEKQHYRISHALTEEVIKYLPGTVTEIALKEEIERNILKELKTIISKHIEIEEDKYKGVFICSLDIWM